MVPVADIGKEAVPGVGGVIVINGSGEHAGCGGNIEHHIDSAIAQAFEQVVVSVGEVRIDFQVVHVLCHRDFRKGFAVFCRFGKSCVSGEGFIQKMEAENIHSGQIDLIGELFDLRF